MDNPVSDAVDSVESEASASAQVDANENDGLHRRLGELDKRQVAIWRAMTPARRLDIAFQAYQFALDAVRVTERRLHPDLTEEELAWRVTRRMQGDDTGTLEMWLTAGSLRRPRQRWLLAIVTLERILGEARRDRCR